MSIQIAGTISSPFGGILVSWMSLLFLGFGVIGRLNLAVAVSMALGACVIGSAMFLILDLGQPFTGFTRISPAPLLLAIDSLDK